MKCTQRHIAEDEKRFARSSLRSLQPEATANLGAVAGRVFRNQSHAAIYVITGKLILLRLIRVTTVLDPQVNSLFFEAANEQPSDGKK